MAKLQKLVLPYALVPNQILFSKTLSLKAKGIFAYMQAKPNGWEFSADRIAEEILEGRDAVQSALRELEKEGYLTRNKFKDEKGLWEWEHTLHEKPSKQANPSQDNQALDNPAIKKQRNINKENTSTLPLEDVATQDKKEEFNTEQWVEKLSESKAIHLQLIYSYYSKYYPVTFKTKAIAERNLKSQLVSASNLTKSYSRDEIRKGLNHCKENYTEWRLSTVEKVLPHLLAKKSN